MTTDGTLTLKITGEEQSSAYYYSKLYASKCRLCKSNGDNDWPNKISLAASSFETIQPCKCKEQVHRGCMIAVIEKERKCKQCGYKYQFYKPCAWSNFWWRHPMKTSVPLFICIVTMAVIGAVLYAYPDSMPLQITIAIAGSIVALSVLLGLWLAYLIVKWKQNCRLQSANMIIYDYTTFNQKPGNSASNRPEK